MTNIVNKVFKYISFVVILFVLLFIISCTTFKSPELISIENIDLVEDNDSVIDVKSSALLYNPNWFTLSLNNVEFNIYRDSIFLGSGYVIDSLYLKHNDTNYIKTIFSLDKLQLILLSNSSDTLNITIVGNTKIPYINKDYYFEFNHLLDIDEILKLFSAKMFNTENIKIKEINVKELNLKNAKFEVLLSVINEFDSKLIIDKLNLTIFKTKDYKYIIGNSSINEQIVLDENIENNVKTVINFNPISLGSSVFSNTLNNNNKLYIKIESDVILNNHIIPVKILKTVEYNPSNFKIKF